ncbi:MAG TPA: PRD domain-containing protein [Enterococcus sp.]|nr:PRD domain-containing protein [Enterococcus sp.]
MLIEKNYNVRIPEDEIAFLTQMFIENKVDIHFNSYTLDESV